MIQKNKPIVDGAFKKQVKIFPKDFKKHIEEEKEVIKELFTGVKQ